MIMNEDVRAFHRLSRDDIAALSAPDVAEVPRRQKLWLDGATEPSLSGLHVLLPDDCIATGTTMLAAIRSVRQLGAAKIGVAVPAALGSSLRHLPADLAPDICPHSTEEKPGVGAAYASFP